MLLRDVNTHPEPSIPYHNLCEKVSQRLQNIKFFHMNVQSITHKLSSVNSSVNDVGVNTIFGFSETWLRQTDGHNLWSINVSKFKCLRCDRSMTNKYEKRWRFYAGLQFACFKINKRFEYFLQASFRVGWDQIQNKGSMIDNVFGKFEPLSCKKPNEGVPCRTWERPWFSNYWK